MLTPPFSNLFADIPSWRASDSPPSTLPTNINTTTSRPDLVLIEDKMVYILELTVPSNNKEALHAAYLRKSNKSFYLEVINELEDRDLSVVYKTLEIGSLGHWETHAIRAIPNIDKKSAKDTLLKMSETAIACSYYIFNSRKHITWDKNKPLYSL